MINEWIIYQKQDGTLGLLPAFVKKIPAKTKTIETFIGREEEAIKHVKDMEKRIGDSGG